MAGNKKYFTDRTLKALPPAKRGERYEIWDSKLPGFGVRVGDERDHHRPGKAGRVTFVYYRRFPNSPSPTRRVLGRYGPMTLETARKKVADWAAMIDAGKYPAVEEQRKQRETQRKQKNTFAAVAEDFIARRVIGPNPERPLQRNGHAVAAKLRNVFIPLWRDSPITEITSDEVKAVIEGVRDYGTEGMLAAHGIKRNGKRRRKGPAPGRARLLLAELKALFRWAVGQGATYGLQLSPCANLSATTIIGEKISVDRVLSDNEVAAFWRVIGRMGYPFGPLYQLLLLTGLRLNEVADATWPEFDLPDRLWTIPSSRMKGTNRKARAHVVPLTGNMLQILDTLPRFQGGNYLFSAKNGAKPVWMTSDVKNRLDAAMLVELREAAKQRGDDPDKVTLTPWVNHDLRRVVRTAMSRLRVNSDVAEAVLAHIQPGIRGVYDRHDLLDEKREALTLWGARLHSIVEPSIADVIDLRARR